MSRRFSIVWKSLFLQGFVGPSTVYSEAALVFSSFCEGKAQQITASGVVAMEKAGIRMGTSQIEVPPSQFFGFDRIDRNLSDNQMLINVIN
ncbi:unnamed protein product, partial [Porites evermanni]